MERLFVYGTLRPGHSNAHILENVGGTWQTGYVSGVFYPQGCGAAAGFPGLVLDCSSPRVEGYVFSSDALSSYWLMLDEFEDGYDRIRTEVTLADGDTVTAYVYQLQPQCTPSRT